jgi:hypothetical protein
MKWLGLSVGRGLHAGTISLQGAGPHISGTGYAYPWTTIMSHRRYHRSWRYCRGPQRNQRRFRRRPRAARLQLRRSRKGICYRVFWRTSRDTRCGCSTWLTRPQTDPRDGSRLRCCTLTLSAALVQPYLVAWPLTGSTMLHRRCKQRGSPAMVYLLNQLMWGSARPYGRRCLLHALFDGVLRNTV